MKRNAMNGQNSWAENLLRLIYVCVCVCVCERERERDRERETVALNESHRAIWTVWVTKGPVEEGGSP